MSATGERMIGSHRRPRLLVFAYAVEPGRGSEPGAGWGVVRALSTVAECVVLVGPTHAVALAERERAQPASGTAFVVVPEAPRPGIRGRGRILWFVAYLRWLRQAEAAARRLHAERAFDAVWHVSYATYWLPTPAVRLGIPCVWGPVGGAVITPLRLWPLLGPGGMATELLDLVAVRTAAALPATRRTWAGAAWRIMQNEATLAALPRRLRDRASVLNHALFADATPAPARPRGSHLLFVGSLESRKGLRLVLNALAQTPPEVCLSVAGDGPARGAMERLARRLGVADRVAFQGRVSRPRVFELFAAAAAGVFAGLREEGGLALAEAMLCGLPVIVLNHGGARAIATWATDRSRVALVEAGTIAATTRGFASAMTRFALHPPPGTAPLLDQAAARVALADLVTRAVSTGKEG